MKLKLLLFSVSLLLMNTKYCNASNEALKNTTKKNLVVNESLEMLFFDEGTNIVMFMQDVKPPCKSTCSSCNPCGSCSPKKAKDCDEDGVPDIQEKIDGTNPGDPCDYKLSSQNIKAVGKKWEDADCNGNGKTNLRDYNERKNPRDPLFVEIPNVITPNGDGYNDYLHIDALQKYEDGKFRYRNNHIEIFNRWGNTVYKADGYNNGSVKFEGISNGRAWK